MSKTQKQDSPKVGQAICYQIDGCAVAFTDVVGIESDGRLILNSGRDDWKFPTFRRCKIHRVIDSTLAKLGLV